MSIITYIKDKLGVKHEIGAKWDNVSGKPFSSVDSALSGTSTNPVQNKVVNTALAGKSDKDHTHSVKINGVAKTIAASDGEAVDLGTYLTEHQDISGKEDKSNKVTSWSSTTTDAHYPSEKLVKAGLDGKQDKLAEGSNITISGNTISATDTTYSEASKTDVEKIVTDLS